MKFICSSLSPQSDRSCQALFMTGKPSQSKRNTLGWSCRLDNKDDEKGVGKKTFKAPHSVTTPLSYQMIQFRGNMISVSDISAGFFTD